MYEADAEFFDRELASFLPPKVFDAHCHLWHDPSAVIPGPDMPDIAGYDQYRDLIGVIHPDREVAALFIPFPHKDADTVAASRWVSQEIRGKPKCRGLYLVKPTDDPEQVREAVKSLGLCGLKVYHVYSGIANTMEAEIPEYLPERLVKVAHEERWVITLHMVKHRAVADESNRHWIRHYCTRYPDMRLILAHSARGFQPAHNLEGLPHLADLPNLYCDTSANCESIAHESVLRTLGPKRLMYGSDFHVSHFRGRNVAAGDGFVWIYGGDPIWESGHEPLSPPLVGMEHLRALKWACWSAGMGDSDVEDIFWNNAAELFGVES